MNLVSFLKATGTIERRLKMKTNTSWKNLIVIVALGAFISSLHGYSAVSDAARSNTVSRSELSVQAAQDSNIVTEWNQQAITLALLPASALTSGPQARVMAIVHVAVHDAANGITEKYETYLSPGPAPNNASPEAAAIAAAHHALKNLFQSQAASLDAFYESSLATHGLSQDDPGIAYGRSAAAAILALRANDHSAEAQFDYSAPGAGSPGVWLRLNNAPAQLPGGGNVTPSGLCS